MTMESLPRAASAEHLTDALRRSGTLGDGRVCDVVVADRFRAQMEQLAYDGAGAGAAPAILITRRNRPWQGHRRPGPRLV